MNDYIDVIYYSLGGAMPAIMMLGIILSAFLPSKNKWYKRYFIALFSVLFLCSVLCFLSLIFYGNPKMIKVQKVLYFFEGFFPSLLVIFPTLFLLYSCGENIKKSVIAKVVSVLWAVFFTANVTATFTDAFYYISADNRFIRSSLFALTIVPLLIIMIMNIAALIKWRKKLTKRYFIALLIYLIPMTAALFVHMFVEADLFVVSGMALLALLTYVLILTDNMEQFTRQQLEIANQRAGVMVLQMRPHFICNSMMGIYYLCDQDPQKAKQVILDFTTYLRKNFTALASENTIPFTEELEHTRAYLAVEQAQFEDTLFVDFDTPHTSFCIPPLTLQPIVENAVKHGMSSTSEPIHISVLTRQTETASEIIVEDDGLGFAPADDNEPHIGLNNIRQRLDLMCGGTLTLSPREGGGTSAKVTIPK